MTNWSPNQTSNYHRYTGSLETYYNLARLFPNPITIDYTAYRPSLRDQAFRWASIWGHVFYTGKLFNPKG